jgi:hypothetical protein
VTFDEALGHVQEIVNDKLVLFPDDFTIMLGMSKKAQANMRSRGTFPIPIHRTPGGAVYATVHDVAAWLSDPHAEPTPQDQGKENLEKKGSSVKTVGELWLG